MGALGRNQKSGIFGSIGSYLEKSALIDLGTILVLGMNFYLLQQNLGFGDSLLEFSKDPAILAAQATGAMMIIYLVETVVDRKT